MALIPIYQLNKLNNKRKNESEHGDLVNPYVQVYLFGLLVTKLFEYYIVMSTIIAPCIMYTYFSLDILL